MSDVDPGNVVLNVEQIKALLPHRPPFLLIERLTDIVPNESAVAYKAVSINEPYFVGHFPNYAVMPGVLIVEAMAQAAGALVMYSTGQSAKNSLVYFMTIDNARFRKPVTPGDLLRMTVKAVRRRGPVWKFSGYAYVGDTLCAEAQFSAMIADGKEDSMAVHPTAIVEDGAALGAGIEVGPFCVVGRDVRLGDGVRLLSHVVVSGKTIIGERTVIHSHAVIGGEAQIYNNDAPGARLEIGSGNTLREGVTINQGSEKGRGVTKVGDDCFFMAGSHIGHDCLIGNNVTLANGAMLGGHFDVGDGVIMGGLAAAQQFGRVGRYAFISGLSGISTDVIPYGIAIGLHVRLGGLNLIGLRRRKIPRENIHALRAAYRAIFLEGKGSIQDNARHVQSVGKWKGMAEVEEVIAFILADAKRPITPARKRGGDDASGED